ncbi:MAG: hypothetical protein QNK31_01795 [Porticoccus sp.]|nr:hypothetical protein [Porticoccus sp.]
MSNHKQQLVVRPHRPGHRKVEIILWVSLSVFLFAAGFMLGFRFFDAAMVEKRQQKLELSGLRDNSAGLEQQLANAELTARIDRVALEQVRQVMTSLQAELAVDKEELSLYRNLLQGGGTENGLLIGELTLKPILELQDIAYRLVVQQKENKLKRINVRIKMTINGLSDGKAVAMGLESLDSQFETSPIQTEFKYFHIVEGVLTIPSEFKPQSITVEMWKKGVNSSRVEREFDWRIDES